MCVAERLAVLTAVDTALADLPRLIAVLSDAEDDADALRRLGHAYDLTEVQAQAVLDGQFLLLSRRHRARRAAEIQALTEGLAGVWDPPLHVQAVVHSPTDVRVVLADEEHRVRGTDLEDSLDRLVQLVRERLAGPRRRRVVITTGLVDGPVRIELDPTGNVRFRHADEEPGPVVSP
ncbi:hypothetical protein DQ244_11845 [Blastococcus sp. TBT05-19]|uniref:hypothetical protein n=1 Tax=Blastococcus sp. TBT05-19 TaxID=2250581 RepID=UPI000DEA8F0B|nr:hypothetical protein [Blastococcus sp. TBT05-19]RBY90157.1 hypothetical protein DQ244_11845 [Blastococcus sp. TBT05-19]